jgi:hypothetical protein
MGKTTAISRIRMHNVRSTPGIAFKKARLFPNSAIDPEFPLKPVRPQP